MGVLDGRIRWTRQTRRITRDGQTQEMDALDGRRRWTDATDADETTQDGQHETDITDAGDRNKEGEAKRRERELTSRRGGIE